MKYFILIVVIIIVISLISIPIFAQPPQKPDSTAAQQQKKYIDSVNALIKEKLYINVAIIDSTYDRIASILSKKEYDQSEAAYQFFTQQLIYTWLEAYRKKQEALSKTQKK